MRAIATCVTRRALSSAASASAAPTLSRASLQQTNGLEEVWETMEEGGHDIYFSDRVKRKIARMEKDQGEWAAETEDDMEKLLQRALVCGGVRLFMRAPARAAARRRHPRAARAAPL